MVNLISIFRWAPKYLCIRLFGLYKLFQFYSIFYNFFTQLLSCNQGMKVELVDSTAVASSPVTRRGKSVDSLRRGCVAWTLVIVPFLTASRVVQFSPRYFQTRWPVFLIESFSSKKNKKQNDYQSYTLVVQVLVASRVTLQNNSTPKRKDQQSCTGSSKCWQ